MFMLICHAQTAASTLPWSLELCWAVWCAKSSLSQMCSVPWPSCTLRLSRKEWWKHGDSRQNWLHSMESLAAESTHFFRRVKQYSKWWITAIAGNILHTLKKYQPVNMNIKWIASSNFSVLVLHVRSLHFNAKCLRKCHNNNNSIMEF